VAGTSTSQQALPPLPKRNSGNGAAVFIVVGVTAALIAALVLVSVIGRRRELAGPPVVEPGEARARREAPLKPSGGKGKGGDDEGDGGTPRRDRPQKR
jgi:hypothetical protein